jgi:hypothetical protein
MRISISSFGRTPPRGSPSRKAPCRPLLAAPEVVHVTVEDVSHALAFGDRDGEREEGDVPLCVERAVDRVDDEEGQAGSEAADLLREDRDVEMREPAQDRVFRRLVDRGRVVAAEAGAGHRLALDPRRKVGEHAAHVVDRLAAEREPVGHSGISSRPEVSFG